MPRNYKWTNQSVLKFAGGADPVTTMEGQARALSLQAMDEGWTGPPFDPLILAQRLGLNIEARGDIADARLQPLQAHEPVGAGGELDDLVARHRRRGGVRAVRRVGEDDLVAVQRTSAEEPGEM